MESFPGIGYSWGLTILQKDGAYIIPAKSPERMPVLYIE